MLLAMLQQEISPPIPSITVDLAKLLRNHRQTLNSVCCAGETDSEDEQSMLVYRMACSAITATEPMEITTDFTDPSSAFLQAQEEFVDKVGDVNATAEVFQSLCMPAMDADHLEMTIIW